MYGPCRSPMKDPQQSVQVNSRRKLMCPDRSYFPTNLYAKMGRFFPPKFPLGEKMTTWTKPMGLAEKFLQMQILHVSLTLRIRKNNFTSSTSERFLLFTTSESKTATLILSSNTQCTSNKNTGKYTQLLAFSKVFLRTLASVLTLGLNFFSRETPMDSNLVRFLGFQPHNQPTKPNQFLIDFVRYISHSGMFFQW